MATRKEKPGAQAPGGGGRAPKRAEPSMLDLLNKALSKKVPFLKKNGQTGKMSVEEAAIEKIADAFANGDQHAMSAVFREAELNGEFKSKVESQRTGVITIYPPIIPGKSHRECWIEWSIEMAKRKIVIDEPDNSPKRD